MKIFPTVLVGFLVAGAGFGLGAFAPQVIWGSPAPSVEVSSQGNGRVQSESQAVQPYRIDRDMLISTVSHYWIADDNLLDRIKAELAFAFASEDDILIVEAVRSWVYAHISRVDGPNLSLSPLEFKLSAGQLFELIEQDVGGFQCGGTATFLAELYSLLGYKAWAYNFGQPEGPASHVVTLVEVPYGAETIVTIQDAFYGYAVYGGSAPIDFFDFTAALAKRQTETLRFELGSFGCKPVLVNSLDADTSKQYFSSIYGIMQRKSGSQLSRFCANNRINRFVTSRDSYTYFDFLSKSGLPREFFYLFLFPINNTGTTEMRNATATAVATLKQRH